MKRRRLVTKRVWLVAAFSAVFVSVFIFGCGLRGTKETKVKEPFTLDFKIDSSNANYFVNGDTFNTLVTSSPFYAGAYPMVGQKTQEFDQQREAKVQEIIAAAVKISDAASTVTPTIDEMRNAYLDCLTVCFKADPKLKTFVKGNMISLTALMSKQAAALVFVNSVQTPAHSAYAKTNMQYLYVIRALKLGQLCVDDTDQILGSAAMLCSAYSNSKNAKVKAAVETLDSKMSVYDSAQGNIVAIVSNMQKVVYGLKQLKSGDHYMALAALDFAERELPKVKNKLDAIKPGKELTTQEIAVLKGSYADYEKSCKLLKMIIDKVKKSDIVDAEVNSGTLQCAYAFSHDFYDKANKAVATGAGQTSGSDFGTLISATWKAIKMAPSSAVEMTSIHLTSGAKIISGMWAGKSAEDAKNSTKSLWDESEARFKDGTQGSQVLRNAKDGMDILEETVGEVVEGSARNSGTNIISTSVVATTSGIIAKAVVGMFTGFAKGVYVLADPTSNTSETVGGVIDLGCSLTGGSKVLARPTMVKDMASKITDWLKPAGIDTAGKALELVVNAETTAALQATNKVILQKIKSMGAAYLAQAGNMGKDSLRDMAIKTFEANMGGLKSAITTILGEQRGAFIDNVVAQIVDDTIQKMITDTLEGNDLNGAYSGRFTGAAGGSIKITISGSSASGSLSGSYQGDGLSGSISGSFDPKTGKLNCNLSGHIGDSQMTVGFTGGLSGSIDENSKVASGSWHASNEYGKPTGAWSARSLSIK